ncbi:MAG: hypothetical protein B6D39_02325 [Anaerolineae bacterium UTCFX2]|jgi:glycosyltransferase involved in cell wall biosynthesis|nr:glycosyltransferase family 4 protein [Anaerolineae bacterium]OQY93917.1 MAG: hypothetical protein B6D39_02325 [Anaerolineae bacterium UTCFX2]
MRIGIAIEETWAFFREIEQELSKYHQITQFHPTDTRFPIFYERLNARQLHRDWSSFLRSNQVVFFEWASGLLETASHFPKTCGMITRLHRYEMYHWAQKINWDAVDRVILVSQAKRNEFARKFPDQAEKTLVISEAVSLDRFQSKIKDFSGQLGTLCHLSPRKRVYELILAFYELNRLQDGFHLHIGGTNHSSYPEYFGILQTLVEKLGLQESVTFYGNVEDPPNWYRNIDLFISNSFSEGLQVSPLEAVASGCYTISHNWDGADEFFSPRELFFSERQLVEIILSYADLSQPEKTAHIERLQDIVRRNHDLDKIKVQIREAVEQVGAGYEPRSRRGA